MTEITHKYRVVHRPDLPERYELVEALLELSGRMELRKPKLEEITVEDSVK